MFVAVVYRFRRLVTGDLASEVDELVANTEASVARGVFGSPSFFVGEELYFGKDRLREVEEEIDHQS